MRYFFSLKIEAKPEQVDKITHIVGVAPNYPQIAWGYKLIVQDNAYTNFVDCFLDILENKYDKLKRIGIRREDISVWMIYEYEEQCNMEFTPRDMKRLGDNGITFCISCYEKSVIE
jgi:hypothetical protein